MAAAPSDVNCWELASWSDAQATHNPYLWMTLDDGWDGIACEHLYYGYPCWTPWS